MSEQVCSSLLSTTYTFCSHSNLEVLACTVPTLCSVGNVSQRAFFNSSRERQDVQKSLPSWVQLAGANTVSGAVPAAAVLLLG